MSGPIDSFINNVAVRLLTRPNAVELLAPAGGEGPDVAELTTEARALRIRLDTLAVDFADGSLTDSQLRAATQRLRTKIAEAEEAIAAAGRVDILAPLVAADDVVSMWEGLDTDRRRRIIDRLMTIAIQPAGRGVRTLDPTSINITVR